MDDGRREENTGLGVKLKVNEEGSHEGVIEPKLISANDK